MKKEKISGYKSFEDYGNVILYRPYGQEGVTPIIHRAMYRVEAGEPMWERRPHCSVFRLHYQRRQCCNQQAL